MQLAKTGQLHPRISIMITLVVTAFLILSQTSRLRRSRPAASTRTRWEKKIHTQKKQSQLCELWIMEFKRLYAVWHFFFFFVSGRSLYTVPKLTPHPAAAKPATLNVQKKEERKKNKTSGATFQEQQHWNRGILPSLHSLTGGHRLN